MDDKLFNAILAMDAYNRGYNQGIMGIADNAAIGNVTVLRESEILAGSAGVNASFYAIAYQDNTTHQVTISYRGTDQFPLDPIAGWGGGAGCIS